MSFELPKKRLRSDDKIFLIENMKHQIVGAKLPSNRQVLQVFFYNKRFIGLDIKSSARLVVDEVLVFWEKARIPVSATWYCAQKLEKLYERWKAIKKNSSRRNTLQTDKENEFVDILDDLFDVAASDALTVMKNNDDREFLLAQRKKGRDGCLIGVDQIGQNKEHKKQERIEAEEKRRKKAEAQNPLYEYGSILNKNVNLALLIF